MSEAERKTLKTLLSKVASAGLEQAILYYAAIKKQRDVLATLSEKDTAVFIAACNAGNCSTKRYYLTDKTARFYAFDLVL